MANRNHIYPAELVSQIEDLVQSGRVDQSWSKSKQYRFKKKYGFGYEYTGGKLWFNDSVDGQKKELIPEDKIEEVLMTMFNNPSTTATSRDWMFKRVFLMYVGIPRRTVNDFLLRQPSYQVHRRVRRAPIIKPIVSK